ncbi:endonuclease/exonuclease/phosphatase domain-containing protein [Heterostelium album PN500]|uniref:Endonuclease/exonuclease/phosphatase domain-containing protein n=1 Tax=Heterostelium pallidum (strain ATCC 26659 / Pp 5 / PN500) TaxID=670386 RepID=D3B8G8_HETP5|nr:endonuclease/exonuclease/phosphatase domain-containing protein [Heterostelium album PN500]EFA82336.1 endonuclease/exonuclease/phosphatase domain-containing protein [Heterostelium album PN500]|eukprot:XP_020434453.1 endonuclease/exonuclease/phosphatase domain-containing protein [Heterostelium album PN500]
MSGHIHSSDWKKELYKAFRSTVISISNETDYILQRISVKVHQGVLRVFPPEIIAPNSKVEFASESNAYFTGSKGSVVYLILRNPTTALASNSPSPTSSPNANSNDREHYNQLQQSLSPQMIGSSSSSLSSSSSGNNILSSSLSASLPSSPSPSNSSSKIPLPLPLTSTLSFFSSITGSPPSSNNNPNESWKNTVLRATRGQFVTIVNKTSRLLIRRDHALEQGSWAVIPPEGIAPGATIEFGTSSGICAGTSGAVHYYSNGLKGDVKLTFNNPFIGENTFSYHCPPNFLIEKQVIPGTISSVVFTINDKTNSISSKDLRSSLPQQQQLQGNHSSHNIVVGDDNIRIITLNVGMLPGVEDRCEMIAKILINLPERYDIVCLQAVFNSGAKERLTRVFKPFYSYLLDKVGEDSGLYFATTFPILWSDFRQFNEGIGLDVHSCKGVQGVKLDISAVKENSVLYVFNAHLQSNPDNTLAWQMVAGDDKLKKAQTVRTLQLQSIRDFISTEFARATSNSSNSSGGSNSSNNIKNALVFLGDMNIIGETEQVISDEGSVILSQVIPELARKINNREITETFSYKLMEHLTNNNIPIRYTGILRSQLLNPRMKSLLLTEMISYILKKDIVDQLAQRHNQLEAQFEGDECTYRTIVLETLNMVFHYDTKASTTYWTTTLKNRLRSEFSSALTELEEFDFVDLRNHVINLQLLTSLKMALEITLQTKAIYQLIKGSRFKSNIPAPLILDSDIEELILPPLTSYWGVDSNNSDISYISNLEKLKISSGGTTNIINENEDNNRIKIYLKPTDEYESMKKILGQMNDLYRQTNPHLPGYTIHQSLNQLVSKPTSKERTDYIFSFNLSPNFGDDDGRNQLLRLNCLESSILPMGATPQTRLSDHFAVECIIKVEDTSSTPVHNRKSNYHHQRNNSNSSSRG